MRRQAWISDTSNKKVKQIKQSFHMSLSEHCKDMRINYYDFLLVAKKLTFRFEESSHLMALKNFFSKNKNSVLIKKLVDALNVNQQSLNTKDDKIIVKFNVPDNQFAPIKEATNQDEEDYYEDEDNLNLDDHHIQQLGSHSSLEASQQINEKMLIILSIKLEQMRTKIKHLTDRFNYPNIFNAFDDYPHQQITYQIFKNGVLLVISNMNDKLKMSEEDIKTIYYLLNPERQQSIRFEDIQRLKNVEDFEQPMKEFYEARINKNMVKNTLFKLGKVKSNNIQIYQLKNASVLQFQQIENSIVNQPTPKHYMRKRVPHFGPLKGNNKSRKNEKSSSSLSIKHSHSQSAVNSNRNGSDINKQREKIEKILRSSKQAKKRSKNSDTVASKLRSLFIHKVILPREKMLEEQKEKYKRAKNTDYQLAIKPLRDAR